MNQNKLIVFFVFVVFFVISFLTNILGPLIPDIVVSYNLSNSLAGFLPFSFFIAYAVMSLPAGLLIEKYSQKKIIIAGFLSALVASLSFALLSTFQVALASLFVIGLGMAMLQVVINPLLREAGGESNFAFNSILAQLFFGSASFLSPLLYSYLVNHIHTGDNNVIISLFNGLVEKNTRWISLYWVFTAVSLLMVIVTLVVKFPRVKLKEEDRVDMGKSFTELIRDKYVLLFFIGIFCYVGTEQGIANWTSKFLEVYHAQDPSTTGARAISYFWGLMTIGCLAGLLFLKLFDSKKVLMVSTTCALFSFGIGLFGNVDQALIFFPLSGLFLSVMWGIIFSLALNSVPRHHGTFSGILCTAIAGGAVVPLVIGALSEVVGLRGAMTVIFLTLGYVLSVSLWARPLIRNATIKTWKKRRSANSVEG
ncbi:MAG: MFS transporter [Chitinophagaceae bacterium]|nr:MFS transporter [Chitinophagaceae bacterium]